MEDLASLGHIFVCVFVYRFSALMVRPAITDITMTALCPGRDECSLAIYLSGVQETVTATGTLLVTPFLGNLSDRYGRKALLTLPMTASIFPLVTLAYSRTKAIYFVYFVLKILAGILSEGSMQCLPVAYVVDKVDEQRRASAISILSGVSMAGTLAGTLASRFLSTTLTFQVSAIMAISAVVYMRIFLVESSRTAIIPVGTLQPKLTSTASEDEVHREPLLLSSRKGSLVWDPVSLLRSSSTLSRAAVLMFFSTVGDAGISSSLLLYLKARFHFNKDQFSDIMLINSAVGVASQLFLMPILVPTVGEEKLLIVGLLASSTQIFLYSIAWASWVPYLTSMITIVSNFCEPSLRSILSKRVGSNEQGVAQGCISSAMSFASILGPLMCTPLTALFLSENAPFYFPGFSFTCAGFLSLIAVTLSVIITWPEPTECSH